MPDELLRFGIVVDGDDARIELRRFLAEVSKVAAESGKASRGMQGLDRSVDDLDREFRDLEKSVSKTERELDRVEKTTRRATEANRQGLSAFDKLSIRISGLNQAYSLLDRTVGRVVRAGFGFTQSVVQTGAQFEAFRVRLEGLTGSAEKAAFVFERMKELSFTTPFLLGDIVEAGIQLRAFGETNTQALKAVADLAAFMKTDAVFAAQAYGRAFAGGAGAADVLRDRGVLEAVKLRTGIEDLTKVSRDTFRRVLLETLQDAEAGIAGSADRLTRSFDGIVSNIQGVIQDALNRIAEAGFFDAVKDEAQGFLDLLNELDRNGQLDQLAQQISGALTQVLSEAVDLAKQISVEDIANAAVAAGQLAVNLASVTADAARFLASLDPAVLRALLGAAGGGIIAGPFGAAAGALGANLRAAFDTTVTALGAVRGIETARYEQRAAADETEAMTVRFGEQLGVVQELNEAWTDFAGRVRAARDAAIGQTLEGDLEGQSLLSADDLAALDSALAATAGAITNTGEAASGATPKVKAMARAFVGPPDSLFETARKAGASLDQFARDISDDLAALDDPTATIRQRFRDMREEITQLGQESGRNVEPLITAVDTLEERTLAAQQNMESGFEKLFDAAIAAFDTFLDALARGTIEIDQIGQSIKASLLRAFTESFTESLKTGILSEFGRAILSGIGLGGADGGGTGIFGLIGKSLLGGAGGGFGNLGGLITTLFRGGTATGAQNPLTFVGPLLANGSQSPSLGAGSGLAGGGLGASLATAGYAAAIIGAILNTERVLSAGNRLRPNSNTLDAIAYTGIVPIIGAIDAFRRGDTTTGVLDILLPTAGRSALLGLGLVNEPSVEELLLADVAELLAGRGIAGAGRFNALVSGERIRPGGRVGRGFGGLSAAQVAFGAILAGAPGTGKSPFFAAQVGQAASRSGLDVEAAARALVNAAEAMRRVNQVFQSGTIAARRYELAVQGIVEIFADLPSRLAERVGDVLVETGGKATAREVRQFINRDVKPAAQATVQAVISSDSLRELADNFIAPVIERLRTSIGQAIVDSFGPVLAVPFFDIRQGFREATRRRSDGGRVVTPAEVQEIIGRTSEDLSLAFEELRGAAELLELANRAGLIFAAELQIASGDFAGAVQTVEAGLAPFIQVLEGIRQLRDDIGTRIDTLLAGDDPLLAARLRVERATERETDLRDRLGRQLDLPAGTSLEDVFATFTSTPQGLFEYIAERIQFGEITGQQTREDILGALPADLAGAFAFSELDPQRQLEIAQEFATVRLETLEAELDLARQQADFYDRAAEGFRRLSEEIDVLRRGPRASRARATFEAQFAEIQDPDLLARALGGGAEGAEAMARILELATSLLPLGASIFGESSSQFVGLLDFLEPVLDQLGITSLDEATKAREREAAAEATLTAFRDDMDAFLEALGANAERSLVEEMGRIATLLGFEGPIYGILWDIAGGLGVEVPPPPDGELARGGPVVRGGRYLVGETGPELFVPTGSGTVIPLSQSLTTGAESGVTVTIPIAVEGTGSASEVADRVSEALRIQHPRLVEELRRAGLRG